MSASVVIVGGGLMGLSAAWHARRADAAARVVVLERAQVGAGASGASAAGVRAMGRDPAERSLALAALARWPELDRELDAATGYRRGGGLRVALDERAWREMPAWVADQRADGVPVEMAEAAVVRRLAPGVAVSVAGGAICAIDGQAEAAAAVSAFASAARRAGVRIEEGVGDAALVLERGRVVAVARPDGRRESCDVAIVAAGTWSASLLAAVGVRLPFGTRALQMLLTEPAPGALGPVLGAFDRKLSLKQLAGGAYLIGGGWAARVPDEAANVWEVLEESVQGSLAVAREVYPPVASAKAVRAWAGLEAFTPDDLPVLGPVPGVDGVLLAAGFCGHGFALAPVIGDVLARLALRREARPELWDKLRVDRLAVVDRSPGRTR